MGRMSAGVGECLLALIGQRWIRLDPQAPPAASTKAPYTCQSYFLVLATQTLHPLPIYAFNALPLGHEEL